MNWKLWTWPAQIRDLKRALETVETLYDKECRERDALEDQLLAKSPALRLADPGWQQTLADLRARLAGTVENDAFYAGVLGLLGANARVELEPLCAAAVPDAEIHRLRGRVAAFMDARTELEKLWRAAQSPVNAGGTGQNRA